MSGEGERQTTTKVSVPFGLGISNLFRFSFGERIVLSVLLVSVTLIFVFALISTQIIAESEVSKTTARLKSESSRTTALMQLFLHPARRIVKMHESGQVTDEELKSRASVACDWMVGFQRVSAEGIENSFYVDGFQPFAPLEPGLMLHEGLGRWYIIVRGRQREGECRYVFDITPVLKTMQSQMQKSLMRLSVNGRFLIHEKPHMLGEPVGFYMKVEDYFHQSFFLPAEAYGTKEPLYYVRSLTSTVGATQVNARLFTGVSSGEIYSQMMFMRSTIASVSLVAFILVLVLALAFSRFIVFPLKQMTAHVSKLNRSNLKSLPVYRRAYNDELSDLSASISQLATDLSSAFTKLEESQQTLESVIAERTAQLRRALNRIEKTNKDLQSVVASQSEQLIATQKRTIIATLVQGLTHNLKSPLANVMGYLHLLKKEISAQEDPDKDQLEWVDMTVENCQKLNEIIESILERSRNRESDKKVHVDVNKMISREVVFMESDLFFKMQIDSQLDFDTGLPSVYCNYSQLSQVVENILRNAREAMQDTERKELKIRTYTRTPYVVMEFSDTGKGMTEDEKRRVFERYFTTKADQPGIGGTGLGLTISRDFMDEMGGKIEFETEAGKGTTVRVSIPFAEGEDNADKAD
ncbi:MAG: HAMP domain-containing sensor histidine kinase [Planctomycetota bacterium]|nr:HAMP domain-containing sensor histidine kinase [Planctomycetota bacterium]